MKETTTEHTTTTIAQYASVIFRHDRLTAGNCKGNFQFSLVSMVTALKTVMLKFLAIGKEGNLTKTRSGPTVVTCDTRLDWILLTIWIHSMTDLSSRVGSCGVWSKQSAVSTSQFARMRSVVTNEMILEFKKGQAKTHLLRNLSWTSSENVKSHQNIFFIQFCYSKKPFHLTQPTTNKSKCNSWLVFLLVDEATASTAVIVIVSWSGGQKHSGVS